MDLFLNYLILIIVLIISTIYIYMFRLLGFLH